MNYGDPSYIFLGAEPQPMRTPYHFLNQVFHIYEYRKEVTTMQ